MFHKKGQLILIFVVIFCVLAVLYFFLQRLQVKYVFFVIFGCIVFIISFLNTNLAFVFLIFSMLFSPEFALGVAGGREVVLRFDDLFLIVIFLGWLAKMAINKDFALFKKSPLNSAIAIYILLYTFSTLRGILAGYVSIKGCIFYLLKYFEYFLLYFMVINEIRERKQINFFVYCILFVSFVVSLYAIRQRFLGIERVSAPFEEKYGEANTLGGYLILNIFIALAIFLNTNNTKLKLSLFVVVATATLVLLFTLSRGSWFAFILSYITLFFLTKRGKALLLFVALFSIIFYSALFPSDVIERIKYTFSPQTERMIFRRIIGIDESFAARLDNWDYSLQLHRTAPIFGRGAGGGRTVVDNQYGRVLIEAGLLGLFAFFMLIFRVLTTYFFILNKFKDDDFVLGLGIGLIAVLVGFLGHSLSAETFILIRTMEPFWFLTALAVKLLDFSTQKATA